MKNLIATMMRKTLKTGLIIIFIYIKKMLSHQVPCGIVLVADILSYCVFGGI